MEADARRARRVPASSLEKRLLWEQDEPILDVAIVGDALLVLTPSALLRTAPRQSVPIASPKPGRATSADACASMATPSR